MATPATLTPKPREAPPVAPVQAPAAAEPEGDVYEVEYFLEHKEDKDLLLRRLCPNPDDRHSHAGILTVIAEHIAAFDVQFFDGDEGEWTNEWPEDSKQMPELVEVNLVVQVAGQKRVATRSFVVNFSRWPQENVSNKETEE